MMDRKSIEQTIIEVSQAVDLLQPEWFKSEEYHKFHLMLSGLKGYYRTHEDDDQISLAAVAEVLVFFRLFIRMLDDQALSSALRERARDEIRDLDSSMEEIFRYGIHYDD